MITRSTPLSLGVKLITGDGVDTLFALSHPIGDDQYDLGTSIIFSYSNGEQQVLRIFETEILWLAFYAGSLFCIDNDHTVYEYLEGRWIDHTNSSVFPNRINRLCAVKSGLFGLTGNGIIFSWVGASWRQVTAEQDGLYLCDLKEWGEHGTFVCGLRGFVAKLVDGRLEGLDLPISTNLNGLLSMTSGELLIVGARSTAFLLSQGETLELQSDRRRAGYINAVLWKEMVLIAANTTIEIVENQTVSTFSDERSGYLFSQGDSIWSLSNGALSNSFDGKDWSLVNLSVEI